MDVQEARKNADKLSDKATDNPTSENCRLAAEAHKKAWENARALFIKTHGKQTPKEHDTLMILVNHHGSLAKHFAYFAELQRRQGK